VTTPNPSPADVAPPVDAAGEALDTASPRYWLTPAGCASTDGHRPDLDQRHCRICGVVLEAAS
jgi:hypothetical protein